METKDHGIPDFEDSSSLKLLFDIPLFVLVTDTNRRIVWANREAQATLSVASIQDIEGKRPGEVLGCVHAKETPEGCGFTKACELCGAGKSLNLALRGGEGGEECVIPRDRVHNFDPLNLLIWTKPLELDGRRYISFTARDISIQKRWEVLDRVFYHDIQNTAASIKSLTSLINMGVTDFTDRNALELIDMVADRLLEEIDAQRSLRDAEDNDLIVHIIQASADRILDEALEPFRPTFQERAILLDRAPPVRDPSISTDPVLARRVVANMVKNALEASHKGDRIHAGVDGTPEAVEIWVWNPAVLSKEEKILMFNRSFSTKGIGRGIGTYSMRLLTERYLGGDVSFESEEDEGTTFRVRLYREPSNLDGSSGRSRG